MNAKKIGVRISCLLALSILLSCASSIRQFYPDSYFTEDGIYQNKALRFSLSFRGNWVLITDPNEMRGNTREFAHDLQERGAELLFVGATSEGAQGVRGIAINLNTLPREYAERVREINADGVSEDFGLRDMLIDGMPMVRWDYVVKDFRFVEFFFTLDTYNTRIAFWTKPAIFERFEPVYLDIMSSLSFISPY